MKLALHIFWKDLRRMAMPVAGLLAVVAIAAYLEVRDHQTKTGHELQPMHNLLFWMLPLGWLAVITGTVHEEPLPGGRQYWLTRPISRLTLLAEKVAFILLFVNFVWFLSDCAILLALGLPVHPLVLLQRQIPMTLIYFAPVFCLAAVTKGLGQVALGLICCALAITLEVLLAGFLSSQSPNTSTFLTLNGSYESATILLPILSILILLLQFLKRTTILSRLLFLLSTLFLPYVLILTLAKGYSSFELFPSSKGPGHLVSAAFDIESGRHPRPTTVDGFSGLELPIRLDGLSPGEFAEGTGWGSLRASNSHLETKLGISLVFIDDGYWLRLTNWGPLPVKGDIQANLTISLSVINADRQFRLAQTKPFSPGPGSICRPEGNGIASFHCWQAPLSGNERILRAFAYLNGARIDLGGTNQGPSVAWAFSPLIDLTIAPARSYAVAFKPDSTVRFLNLIPSGSLQRPVSATDLMLLPYIVKP